MSNIKRTPLYATHQQAGAKMVEFGGWEMPIQYAGILDEHKMCRTNAGLFDVSHMGEIDVTGPDALKLVNKLITNDASKLAINQIQYSPMCDLEGGVIDDLLVYKMADEHYYIVVNASNTDKDFAWFRENIQGLDVQIKNISDETAQIAIQGPKAKDILQQITDNELESIKYYWFDFGQVDGVDCLISRTGYTGEDGFELYFKPESAAQLWDKLMEIGAGSLAPVGLGARDTLRLEAGMPLCGHELTSEITPLNAGLGYFVKLDKDDFNGKKALSLLKQNGFDCKNVGFEMVGRGIPRSDYKVLINGQEIGWVTSGTYSPTLEKNIGYAFIKAQYAALDSVFDVEIRGKAVPAKVIKTPFYKRSK